MDAFFSPGRLIWFEIGIILLIAELFLDERYVLLRGITALMLGILTRHGLIPSNGLMIIWIVASSVACAALAWDRKRKSTPYS